MLLLVIGTSVNLETEPTFSDAQNAAKNQRLMYWARRTILMSPAPTVQKIKMGWQSPFVQSATIRCAIYVKPHMRGRNRPEVCFRKVHLALNIVGLRCFSEINLKLLKMCQLCPRHPQPERQQTSQIKF